METLSRLVDFLEWLVWTSGIPVGDETIPFVVIALLGAGVYLTLRLAFLQVRRFGHGVAVTTGKYDDPDEEAARKRRRAGERADVGATKS